MKVYKNKKFIAAVAIFIIGAVLMHLIDSRYYTHQNDKTNARNLLLQSQMSQDFDYLSGHSNFNQIDCAQFKLAFHQTQCKSYK